MKRYIRSVDYSNLDYSKYCRRIVPGMYWDVDGHTMTVVNTLGKTAKISEEWISEDSGKEIKKTATWYIDPDEGGEYVYPKNYPSYHLHSGGAFNTYELAEKLEHDGESADNRDYDAQYDYDDYEEDYRSSTRGDYGPGNPWDAPGMSIHDFIQQKERIYENTAFLDSCKNEISMIYIYTDDVQWNYDGDPEVIVRDLYDLQDKVSEADYDFIANSYVHEWFIDGDELHVYVV